MCNMVNDLLAVDNSNFQQFDDRVSFGMQFGQGYLSSSLAPVLGAQDQTATTNSNNFNYNSLSIEVEKLFDVGIWFDVQIANLNSYSQSNFTPNPLGNFQYIADVKAKIGYNFQLLSNLALTPYLLVGKSANIGTINVGGGGLYGLSGQNGIAQDFYFNTGGGLRLEYIINKYFDIYLDQFASYNADQAPLSTNSIFESEGLQGFGVIDTSNMQYTTTLGLKIDLWQDLQLGASLFYTNYNYGQPTLDFYNPGGGLATNEYGALLQVGWTFK